MIPLSSQVSGGTKSPYSGTPAQQVLARICDLADKNGMSRAQKEFSKVCVKMLADSDPLRDRLKAHVVAV